MSRKWKCQDEGCNEEFDTFEELEKHHKYVDKVNKLIKKSIKGYRKKINEK